MKTLKKRSEFLAVAKGVRAARRAFVLQSKCDPDSTCEPRVGYTVTKRTGNSPERNRIRRRLRAAIAAVGADAARPGCDYVLVGRRAALDISFSELKKDLAAGFKRVHNGPDTPKTPGHAARGSRQPATTAGRNAVGPDPR
ncbi:ribonuclease P protein component [Breoghania sp. L-A4]|nr:ribonuclease P protein component [Breoghania sp. L-A4]